MKHNLKPKIIIASLLISIIALYIYFFHFVKTIDTNNRSCYNSCPKVTQDIEDSTFIDNDLYVVSFNKKTKFANYVAHKVKKENILGNFKEREYVKDPKLFATDTIFNEDYINANSVCKYDKGHLATLSDFSNNKDSYKLNYSSNLIPQSSFINQVPVNKLERKIQSLTSIYDDIYIVTGVFYKKNAFMCEWNTNKRIDYIIPSGYYKIILAIKDKTIYTSTFVFDANDKSDKICNYASNIKYVSKIANTQFSFKDEENIAEFNCSNSEKIRAINQ